MNYVIMNGYEHLGTVDDLTEVYKIISDDAAKKEKAYGMTLELKTVLSGAIYDAYIYEYPTLYKEVYVVEIKR